MKRIVLAIALCFITHPGWSADPDPAQKSAAEALAGAAIAAEIVYDAAGNVEKLAISNHAGTERGKAGNQSAPGVTPELFKRILELPNIEAVAIEKQPLGNDSYGLLGKLKKLRDVRLQYMDAKSGATGDAPMFINELPLPLEVLELKHCFSFSDGCMEKLKPQPELKKLEIDTGFATGEAVAFIKHSPKLVNLQIHRTAMSDPEIQEVFRALPELEQLMVRPAKSKSKPITGASLHALAGCRKLRNVYLGELWGSLPYEGGLDVFAGLPAMRELTLAPGDVKGFSIQDSAVRKLHQARPDIFIRVGKDHLGGPPDFKPENMDEPWNWDKGVNTHG